MCSVISEMILSITVSGVFGLGAEIKVYAVDCTDSEEVYWGGSGEGIDQRELRESVGGMSKKGVVGLLTKSRAHKGKVDHAHLG